MTMPLALFLSVLMLSVFSFISVAVWSDNRRKEREALHKSETLRKLAESGEAGVALLREQERIASVRAREGLKIGGLVNAAVGVGLLAFLLMLTGSPVAFSGLIPLFIGLALLVYAYFLAPKD
ncbi:MAG TPA: DUF6249 domain-containing protein [Verrucomicrobiae bacterium]|nr:DUF6249 domain-containing protein [Verrucomicrobiae bacterium]